MTNTPRPMPENVSVEQQQFRAKHPSYAEAISLVHQAVYEFRRTHATPDDPSLPIVRSYEAPNGAMVDIISTRTTHTAVQVEQGGSRLVYVCDSSADYFLTVSQFDNDSSVSSKTWGVSPSQEGLSLLLEAYQYLRDGTDN